MDNKLGGHDLRYWLGILGEAANEGQDTIRGENVHAATSWVWAGIAHLENRILELEQELGRDDDI